jgi:hypothetical protein
VLRRVLVGPPGYHSVIGSYGLPDGDWYQKRHRQTWRPWLAVCGLQHGRRRPGSRDPVPRYHRSPRRPAATWGCPAEGRLGPGGRAIASLCAHLDSGLGARFDLARSIDSFPRARADRGDIRWVPRIPDTDTKQRCARLESAVFFREDAALLLDGACDESGLALETRLRGTAESSAH